MGALKLFADLSVYGATGSSFIHRSYFQFGTTGEVGNVRYITTAYAKGPVIELALQEIQQIVRERIMTLIHVIKLDVQVLYMYFSFDTRELQHITKIRLCNILQFFTAVK